MHKLTLMLLAAVAACSSGTEPDKPLPTSGSLTVVVDGLAAGKVGGIHFQGADGVDHYVQAKPGSNLILSGAAFGTYRLQFDTVWFEDSGAATGARKFDGSRWAATPLSITAAIDASRPDATIPTAFHPVTGGITVSQTGSGQFLFEILRPDGTGCHCTSWGGNGERAGTALTVQDILAGTWRVHFLPITITSGSPHEPPGSAYVEIPNPEYVTVTVTAGQITSASATYTRQ